MARAMLLMALFASPIISLALLAFIIPGTTNPVIRSLAGLACPFVGILVAAILVIAVVRSDGR